MRSGDKGSRSTEHPPRIACTLPEALFASPILRSDGQRVCNEPTGAQTHPWVEYRRRRLKQRRNQLRLTGRGAAHSVHICEYAPETVPFRSRESSLRHLDDAVEGFAVIFPVCLNHNGIVAVFQGFLQSHSGHDAFCLRGLVQHTVDRASSLDNYQGLAPQDGISPDLRFHRQSGNQQTGKGGIAGNSGHRPLTKRSHDQFDEK